MGKRVALTFRFEEKTARYADALRAVGVEPVRFQAGRDAPSIQGMAGLLLSGGTDINPARYGAAPGTRTQAPDEERDEMEWRLLDQAVAADIPVLAICRGMQLFNVHQGGTLVQHLDGHEVRGMDPSEPAHCVVQEPGSWLARILGPGPEEVNSRHHQAVEQVGRGLLVTSRSPVDGLCEGLERPDLRFAVAVQWHPEDQFRRFPAQRRLFEAFAAAL